MHINAISAVGTRFDFLVQVVYRRVVSRRLMYKENVLPCIWAGSRRAA
jgi:hypothetical protein